LARISHKKIRQLMQQRRKTVTDSQFFSSRLLAGHFEDMAAAQTRQYGYTRRVRVRTVWEPGNTDAAYTDNELIWINAGHSLVTAKSTRLERYDMVCGFFAHELGHVLYTDFLAIQSHAVSFKSLRWYPGPPALDTPVEDLNEADLWAYVKSDASHLAALIKFSHSLANIIEDGYIENCMLNRYPGVLGCSLGILRASQFEGIPTLTQLIEKESNGGHIWVSIAQLILSYVKFGELKYGDEPFTDERVQTVFSLLSELDAALTAENAKERWGFINTILIQCWPYIKSFLELCEQKSAVQSVSDGNADGELGGRTSNIVGQSREAAGTTAPVAVKKAKRKSASIASKKSVMQPVAAVDDPGNPNSGDSAGMNSANQDTETGSSDQGGTETGTSENETAGVNAPDSETAETEAAEAGASDSEAETDNTDVETSGAAAPDQETDPGEFADSDTQLETENADEYTPDESNSDPTKPYQDVSQSESGRIPLSQTDRVGVPTGGETAVDNNYTGSGYQKSADDIDRLLENITENIVETELEEDRLAELNDLANVISYGDIHKGVNKTVHRIIDVNDELKEYYNQIAAPLLRISKQLQKTVSQQLTDRRRGGKQAGLLIGRRLDSHSLHRRDGRMFYKNSLPNEAPEMAVALLVDESGSMSCSDRVTYARAAAIILYEFCRALDIPILIYGHSTGYTARSDVVDLYAYAEYDDIDGNDRYRLMDISSRSCNRDGAALRFVAERLLKRGEDIKILIIVSDGQPYDTGYEGTAAEEDLRGIKAEYTRKGILFIAAAIGDDKTNIERIYGDSYLDITDLNKLPVILTKVIKNHMRL